MDVIEAPSPNFDTRAGTAVDLVVLHYTGMHSGADALKRLCDPTTKVSAHYLIEEDGQIFRLVGEGDRAWHAGISSWHGRADTNARSIGIELVNPGHEFGYRLFPKAQMQSLVVLLRDIFTRHPISPYAVVGHSDVAPARKSDPGELFDWAWLAGKGFGLWPRLDFAPSPHAPSLAPGMGGGGVIDLQLALSAIGYDVQGSGVFDEQTGAVVTAFQRHFRPASVNGVGDGETLSLIYHLAGLASEAQQE